MELNLKMPLRRVSDVRYHKNVELDQEAVDFEFQKANMGRVFSAMDSIMQVPTLVAGALMPDACPTGQLPFPSVESLLLKMQFIQDFIALIFAVQ